MGIRKLKWWLPNEILPGDYICRVNDFEVNLETTQEEIFSIIRNTLLSVDGTSGKKAKKTKVMLQRKKQSHEHRKLERRKNESSPLNDCSQPPPKPTTGTYV